jgi:hypothetical protein
MPTAKPGSARIEIAATPNRFTGSSSTSPAWVSGARNVTAASGSTVQARQSQEPACGYNKLGPFRWQATAVITAADEGRLFAFTTIHDKTGREETAWRYDLLPSLAGILLKESFEFVWCPVVNRLTELPVPRGRQVSRGILLTLSKIKAAAEAAAPAT